jgi:hypothetical protein
MACASFRGSCPFKRVNMSGDTLRAPKVPKVTLLRLYGCIPTSLLSPFVTLRRLLSACFYCIGDRMTEVTQKLTQLDRKKYKRYRESLSPLSPEARKPAWL